LKSVETSGFLMLSNERVAAKPPVLIETS
jgi:hypothetical protein